MLFIGNDPRYLYGKPFLFGSFDLPYFRLPSPEICHIQFYSLIFTAIPPSGIDLVGQNVSYGHLAPPPKRKLFQSFHLPILFGIFQSIVFRGDFKLKQFRLDLSDVELILCVPVINHFHHLGFGFIELVFADRIIVSVSEQRPTTVKLPGLDSPFHSALGSLHYFRSLELTKRAKDGEEQFIIWSRRALRS